MLNWIFLFLIGGAVLTGAFTGTMKQVTDASLASARSAVELALSLVGQMGLWLGFMRVLQEAGLMRSLARGLSPIMRRLFPSVPPEHPAMGAMIMNISANMLGLGNAATPFGLKAMVELDKLNPHKGVATNPMALFLAINTSGVAVLPLGAVAVRAALGSNDPAGIILPSLIATFISTLVGILVVKALEHRRAFAPERYEAIDLPTAAADAPAAGMAKAEEAAVEAPPTTPARGAITAVVWVAMLAALVIHLRQASASASGFDLTRQILSDWLLPLLMLTIVSVGFAHQVKVYEAFIAGAKEAFQIAIAIIPFLIAILVAVGMFRASGAMQLVASAVSPVTDFLGVPTDALPMALIRPLSGSGAFALMTEIMKTNGPDSLVGYMVSVMNGSTETTFYVLAVYFGAVQVRSTRHTVPACLATDVVGLSLAVVVSRLFFA